MAGFDVARPGHGRDGNSWARLPPGVKRLTEPRVDGARGPATFLGGRNRRGSKGKLYNRSFGRGGPPVSDEAHILKKTSNPFDASATIGRPRGLTPLRVSYLPQVHGP
jgi:hypothetical protein